VSLFGSSRDDIRQPLVFARFVPALVVTAWLLALVAASLLCACCDATAQHVASRHGCRFNTHETAERVSQGTLVLLRRWSARVAGGVGAARFLGRGSYPGEDEEDNGSTTVPNEALREMMQAMTSLHAELAAVKAEAAQQRSEVDQLKSELSKKGEDSTTDASSTASSSTDQSPAFGPSFSNVIV
jgi:hypothetical protein